MAYEYVTADASTTTGAKFATERYTQGSDNIEFPVCLIAFGPDGGPFVLTSSANPLPVTFSGAIDTELPTAAALADNTANPTAPLVGGCILVWDGSTWDRAPGTSADGLLVNLGANNDVTVTGSVTANAGTNLNTSALALESGGNLATAATALAVIDDWDESDRAKVNLIASQAGITGGAGAVAANTPRTTLASDDPAVAALQIMDDWDESDRAKVNPIAGQAGVQGGSGTVSALTQRVVLATDVALPAGTNAIGKLAANSGVDIGDVDVTSVPSDPFGVNADAASATGSISAKLRFIAATGIPITSLPASTNTIEVVGDVAHDAAAAGNPVLVGAYAVNAEPAAVANADAARLITDLVGKLITRPHCNPENQLSGVNSATGTSDTSVISAQGAGVRIYVTSISVANSSSNNAIIEVKSATTVIWRTIAPATSGSNITFDPPLRLTANEALNMASLTGSTTIYFSANGYKGV